MESPSRILGPFAVASGVSRVGRDSAEARVGRYGNRAAAAKSKDMLVLALFVALAGGVAPAGAGPANAGTARSPALVYVSDSENDLIDIFDRSGRQVGEITSGRCLHVCAKSRLRRRFSCVSCGFTTHADVNAALEIRRRAQSARTSALSRVRIPLMSHDAA